MKIELEQVEPAEIESRSMEIIESELPHEIDPKLAPIIKRAVHTAADFDYVDNLCFSEDVDYVDNLCFSEDVVDKALEAIKNGACIVTDTNMAKAGINKAELKKHGGEVFCFMSDDDVRDIAKKNGSTRARTSMDKAASLDKPLIFAIGNAPTALIRLYELIQEGKLNPELIIGVPVGFVNVVQSKELIMQCDVPYIVARGRKGGSNVAAAISNALLYMLRDQNK